VERGHTVEQCALHVIFSRHDRRNANMLEATDLASMQLEVASSSAGRSARGGGGGRGEAAPPPDSGDVKRIMRFIDEDGSGSLDRGEFIEWIESGMGKGKGALEKFAAQGETEALLVRFLRGVVAHVRAWAAAFEEVFASADGRAWPKYKFWGMMESREVGAGSFSNASASSSAAAAELLCDALCATGEYKKRGLVHRDDVLDFIVHVSLHGAYRKQTITQLQRRCYNMLLAVVNANVRSATSQARNVVGNPLIVLAASAMFSTYDSSGDDVLDSAELRRLLTSVCADEYTGEPPTRESTQELMNVLDVDGDGMLSREEFIQVVLQLVNADRSVQKSEPPPALAVPLEIAVVNLAQQLQGRRAMLHRLHKKYAKETAANGAGGLLLGWEGMSRLLRHCQKKQRNNSGSSGKPVKVTNSAVNAVMQCIEKAAAASGATLPRSAEKDAVLLPAAAFSGPLLLASCSHPAQLQQQQQGSREAGMALTMYSLVNDEVGRMSKEGSKKKPRNRARSRSDSGATESPLDSDDDDDGFGEEIREGNAVDFGW
jgi:Ca2+-binding EF-hand superfamily protein